MNPRASEQAAASGERFVVWSPDTASCMIWGSRARAEQFAQFWRDTRLLGSHAWRVGRVVAEPDGAAHAPLRRQAPAADTEHRGNRPASPPALPSALASAARPDEMAGQATRCGLSNMADDALATARDEFVALLAAKDVLIAQLRHQVNDLTLATVREATNQARRITELEQRLALANRRGDR